MPLPSTIPTPALCRLCRHPLTRAALKCPYCGARLSWTGLGRTGHPVGMPLRRRVVTYASGLVLLGVIAALWFWVLRDIKTPLSAVEGPPASNRSSTTECATLINELKRTPDKRITPEIRDRLRLCLEGR